MQSNVPENQPLQPVDSPLMPMLPQAPVMAPGAVAPISASGPATAAATGASSGVSSQQVLEQAKQLAIQYGRDPFKLSGTFGKLKEQYLAEHYHVVPNSVDR